MTLKTFRRIVDAIFRRWPIYLAVFCLVAGFGFRRIIQTEDTFSADGSVFVDNNPLVVAQSGISNGSVFSWMSPAQFTSQELVGLLQTDIFLAAVVERADVGLAPGPSIAIGDGESRPVRPDTFFELNEVVPPPDPAAWATQAADLRASISTWALSESLVNISMSTGDPNLSYRMTTAIIEEFVQFQITIDIAESAASEEFFAELALDYQEDVVEARDDLDVALRRVQADEELTPEEDLQIERLKETEILAVSRFRAASDDVEQARLAILQTQTDVRQSYSIFDPPRLPTQPDLSLLDSISLAGLFIIVGLGSALIVPIAVGLLDRTALCPDDLAGIAATVGTVPRVRRSLVRLDKIPADVGVEGEQLRAERVERDATKTLEFKSHLLAMGNATAEPGASQSADADGFGLAEAQAFPEPNRATGPTCPTWPTSRCGGPGRDRRRHGVRFDRRVRVARPGRANRRVGAVQRRSGRRQCGRHHGGTTTTIGAGTRARPLHRHDR